MDYLLLAGLVWWLSPSGEKRPASSTSGIGALLFMFVTGAIFVYAFKVGFKEALQFAHQAILALPWVGAVLASALWFLAEGSEKQQAGKKALLMIAIAVFMTVAILLVNYAASTFGPAS